MVDQHQEAELTAGTKIVPGERYGFFTDTTLCIGCKACEVACKEWNQLPAEEGGLTGMSYDNTEALSATTWRHVAFIEKMAADGARPTDMEGFQSQWLMMSDVCKHCANAPCLEACPTGAIFRTEFDTVVVQQDICNGCGYCVPACPFGVVALDTLDGKAHKCTLCYDRLKGGMEPACAKACPTELDPVRPARRPRPYRRAARRRPARARRGRRVSLRRAGNAGGDRRPRPAERVLPAARPPGDLQPARRAQPAGPARRARARHRPRRDGRARRRGIRPVPGGTARPMTAMGREWQGETYYGRAALKPAPWKWYVAAYISASGMAGGAQMVAACARFADPEGSRALVRNARVLAAGGALAGAALLIADLGTKRRWYNMLRIFRATSPMSIGTYILSTFGLATGATLLGALPLGRTAGRVADAAQVPAGLAGAGLGTYTASLLAATSTPAWSADPAALGARFATESVASAAAALAIGERLGGRDAMADRLDTVALVAAGGHLVATWRRDPSAASLALGGAVPLAAYAAYRLGGRRRPALALLGAASLIAGGAIGRAALVRAGQRSAERPEDYFAAAQPAPGKAP